MCIDERASKAQRLDPACEVEALRERVRALQLENEQLKEAAVAAELRAGAAELRAVAAEARAAEAWAAGARTAEAASATPMAEPAVRSLVQTAQTARPAMKKGDERKSCVSLKTRSHVPVHSGAMVGSAMGDRPSSCATSSRASNRSAAVADSPRVQPAASASSRAFE